MTKNYSLNEIRKSLKKLNIKKKRCGLCFGQSSEFWKTKN